MRHLLALLLGIGAALLLACGGSTKGGIPAASAGELKTQLTDVQQAVEDGRCDDVSGQLRQVDTDIDALPSTVDARLLQSLRDAGERLRETAAGECAESTQTTTEPQPTVTQPPAKTTPPTTTAPTETQTEPQQTTTTPPPVAPEPTPEPEEPQPEQVPPAVEPATPGGGATPGVGATPGDEDE